MKNTDLTELEQLAKVISETNLSVNGTIVGKYGNYEVVSYINEIVIIDDLEQEIISIDRDRSTDD